MATFRITGPDGGSYNVTAPEGASEQDVMAYVQKSMASSDPSNGAGRFAAPKMATAKEPPSQLAAGLDGAAQGLSFGFSDEIEGGARALLKKATGDDRGLLDLYNEGVAIPRERVKNASEAHPVTYHGSQIASGFAVPGGLARLGIQGAMAGAAGRGLGARTVAGVKEGAAYGAAYGAGNAEGDGTVGGGAEATLGGAVKGGATGGAIGGALPTAIVAGSALARPIINPIRGALNPQGMAAEKFTEAASRDLSRLDNKQGNAMSRLAERVDDMSLTNPSVRTMDAGGENVRGLMKAASNVPNQQRDVTRRIVDARQANQWSRIESAADKGLVPGKQAAQTADDIIAAREAAAGPNFAIARATDTPVTQRLFDVIQRPTMLKVGERVANRLKDEGKALEPAQRTEWLHQVKVELDTLIGQSLKAEKMGNPPNAGFEAGALVKLKNDLVSAIDNEPYKKALREFAGPSALKNAVEAGRDDFMKMTAYEVRKSIGTLSPSEQEMWRLGAKEAVFKAIERGNVTRDRTDGVFSSPEMQKRLQALFPDQKSFREFQKELVIEAKMADSRKALQGNSSTAKQLTEGEQGGKASRLTMAAVHAALRPSLERTLNVAAQGKSFFSGITPSVGNELLRMGMSKDTTQLNALANQAFANAGRAPAQQARVAQSGTAGLANALLAQTPRGSLADGVERPISWR